MGRGAKLGDLPDKELIIKPACPMECLDGALFKRRSYLCSDRKDFLQAYEKITGTSKYIVQRFIAGRGCGIFGIMTPDGLFALSCHERIRMMNPLGSGASACRSMRVPTELISPTEKFLSSLQYVGLFMIELMRDDYGKYWFIELNARTWGSTSLARRLKAEYPAWAAKLAFNTLSSLPKEIPFSQVTCRHLGREILHLLTVIRGPRQNAIAPWPGRIRTIIDLLKRYPNQHLYNTCPDDRWFCFVDAYETVKRVIVGK